MQKSRIILLFSVITVLLLVLVGIDLSTGQIDISFNTILKFLTFQSIENEGIYLLIKEFRFQRVFVALLTGSALAISGLLMQTSFRNPLAGPYVLGISSGASLGVALIILGSGLLHINTINVSSNFSLLISAGLGAALVLSIILAISLRIRDNVSILIIGILIAGVVSSIVSILQYYANDINVKSYVIWTMGNLNAVSFINILVISPIIIISSIFLFAISKNLNLMLPGETFAKTMGVNVKLQRIIIYTGVSILTGTVTAFCGPIGFIGIAAPHVARWVFKTSNHFILIPAAMLIGSLFLVSSDIISHLLTEKGIIPINAITAILGAPFIIWVVIKNKRTIV
ncbi:MAG: iron ABC transporter [Marinilabiliales bacterium]|nr:MAG: iron ABC transporter [Marinilabiliales bacterium]